MTIGEKMVNYKSAVPGPTQVLRAQFGRSRMLAGLLLVMHLGGIALGAMFLDSWGLSAILTVALVTSLASGLSRHALRISPGAVTGLLLRPEGRCILETRDGARREGRILASSFVSVPLTIINVALEDGGRTVSAVVLPDSVPQDDLRRIRLWLRHRCAAGEDDSGVA
jgi:hypothetical protein